MRKLLEVYKKCRYMDRLMSTSFFHEDKFMGLIERVRRVSTTTTAARVLDHKNRLFHENSPSTPPASGIVTSPTITHLKLQLPSPNTSAQKTKLKPYKMVRNDMMTPESGSVKDAHNYLRKYSIDKQPIVVVDDEDSMLNSSSELDLDSPVVGSMDPPAYGSTPNKLFGVVMTNIDKASKETEDISRLSIQQEGGTHNSTSKSISNYDSGNHSKTEWGEASCCSSSDITTDINSSSLIKPSGDDHTSNSCCSIELAGSDDLSEFVCARLSSLIKAQLMNALKEINNRFSCKVSFSSENMKIDELSGTSIITPSEGADEESVIAANALHKNTADICLSAANDGEDFRSLKDIESVVGDMDSRCSTTVPTTPVPDNIAPVPSECFVILDSAPQMHTFQLTLFHPVNAQQFYRAVQFDHKLLQSALPPGVWVR